ncbi:hypothetical protein VNO78_02643 [Psophocarpus tetragonolobus]|uniref:Uncharacterized protein n=1 Tax=Psophocarpus tetragonolobus TaxID=3891 RepID=A0AAN9XV77_PSOTE
MRSYQLRLIDLEIVLVLSCSGRCKMRLIWRENQTLFGLGHISLGLMCKGSKEKEKQKGAAGRWIMAKKEVMGSKHKGRLEGGQKAGEAWIRLNQRKFKNEKGHNEGRCIKDSNEAKALEIKSVDAEKESNVGRIGGCGHGIVGGKRMVRRGRPRKRVK